MPIPRIDEVLDEVGELRKIAALHLFKIGMSPRQICKILDWSIARFMVILRKAL